MRRNGDAREPCPQMSSDVRSFEEGHSWSGPRARDTEIKDSLPFGITSLPGSKPQRILEPVGEAEASAAGEQLAKE